MHHSNACHHIFKSILSLHCYVFVCCQCLLEHSSDPFRSCLSRNPNESIPTYLFSISISQKIEHRYHMPCTIFRFCSLTIQAPSADFPSTAPKPDVADPWHNAPIDGCNKHVTVWHQIESVGWNMLKRFETCIIDWILTSCPRRFCRIEMCDSCIFHYVSLMQDPRMDSGWHRCVKWIEMIDRCLFLSYWQP